MCKCNTNETYVVQPAESQSESNIKAPLLVPTRGSTKARDDEELQIQFQQQQVHRHQQNKAQKQRTHAREDAATTSEFRVYIKEAKEISSIALPMILTGLLLYSRSMISMLFLGRLGDLSLAGGSLALGFANITGYSILSGLAMGMEPICGQAFGAKKYVKLLGLTLQRTILLLVFTSFLISILWINMKRILLFCGQDEVIANQAQLYLIYSLPDLLAQSLLHPLRIYLRAQSITLPLTFCTGLAIILHVPINYLLVSHFHLGIRGVALSAVWTNFNIVGALILYIAASGIYKATWTGVSMECFRGFEALLNLAIPSCISVCLEWWWYEIMILLCGVLLNPRATVASMGILIQTTSLIYIFPSSLSFSVSTRVGNEVGAVHPTEAKRAANVGLFFSFLLGFSALAFTIMVRHKWAWLFTEDGEIIGLTSSVLPIIGLCELGNCPQTTGCGVLRGTARPKIGANINLGCFYLVGMPVAVWLGFFNGYNFQGLWIGLLAAQGSCVVTMLFVLGRTDWSRETDRAKQLMLSNDGGDGGAVGNESDDDSQQHDIEVENRNNGGGGGGGCYAVLEAEQQAPRSN